MKKRVVVTGMGCLTPFGEGVDLLWDNIIRGNSNIGFIKFDKSFYKGTVAGYIPDFDFEKYVDLKEARRMDKFLLSALISAIMAMEDSGIDTSKEDLTRCGVIASAAVGGYETLQKNHEVMLQRGYNKCSPFMLPMTIINMAAGKISIRFGFRGINKSVVSACATGTHSIGDSYKAIQYGDADIMIATGAEAGICHIGYAGFAAARTLTKANENPKTASRPFDSKRDGFILSEGAGTLILEEREHAIKRGAKIYAEIIGYGQSSDAYDMVAPDPNGNGAILAINNALKDADIKPDDIDYINAHATSTVIGDIAESKAIEKVFGNIDENKNLLVSSTKSMTGHMIAAAGSVESIICIKTILSGIVPPTINLDELDENVAKLDYVANEARKKEVNTAMSNSFGFGGTNAVLIFKKHE